MDLNETEQQKKDIEKDKTEAQHIAFVRSAAIALFYATWSGLFVRVSTRAVIKLDSF